MKRVKELSPSEVPKFLAAYKPNGMVQEKKKKTTKNLSSCLYSPVSNLENVSFFLWYIKIFIKKKKRPPHSIFQTRVSERRYLKGGEKMYDSTYFQER